MCISLNINLCKIYTTMVIIKPPHCHRATQIHFEGSPLKGFDELPPFGSVECRKFSLKKSKKKQLPRFDIENLAVLLWMLGEFSGIFSFRHKDAKSGIIVRLEWGEVLNWSLKRLFWSSLYNGKVSAIPTCSYMDNQQKKNLTPPAPRFITSVVPHIYGNPPLKRTLHRNRTAENLPPKLKLEFSVKFQSVKLLNKFPFPAFFCK